MWSLYQNDSLDVIYSPYKSGFMHYCSLLGQLFILPPTGRNFVQLERTSFQCGRPSNFLLTNRKSKSLTIILPFSFSNSLLSRTVHRASFLALFSPLVLFTLLRDTPRYFALPLSVRPHNEHHSYVFIR